LFNSEWRIGQREGGEKNSGRAIEEGALEKVARQVRTQGRLLSEVGGKG